MTSELTNKQQLRIALVGVAPADQITLKGYMRVLLRLDVNLEWVSAAESGVGLYIINQDFKNAESVVRLLELNKGIPKLYIANDPMGNGGISGDLLTLPLKQIGLLSDWLTRNVPALSGITPTIASTHTPTDSPVSTPAPTPIANAIQTHTANNHSMQAIIDLIEKLHSRSKSLFEIVDGSTVVAIIDGSRQMAWLKTTTATLNERWQLRPYHGSTPTGEPLDANAWLWSVAWKNPSAITSLINNHDRYQLRYWIKPNLGQDRRDLLQIMTAMEQKAQSVAEIAAKAGVSNTTAKNAIAALLLSGNLTADSYKEIKVSESSVPASIPAPTSTPTPSVASSASVAAPKPAPAPEPARVAPPKAPEQEEKLGFLAKLRRKLGL